MPRGPSEEVERRILELAADAPRRTRLPARIGFGLAVGLVVTTLSVAVHPRADFSRLSLVEFTVSTGGLALVALLAMTLSLRSRSSTGPRVSWLISVVAATTPLFAAVTLLLPLGQAPAVSPWTSVKGGLGCLAR